MCSIVYLDKCILRLKEKTPYDAKYVSLQQLFIYTMFYATVDRSSTVDKKH